MNKHTPGPWEVQRTYTALEIRTAESKPVATLPGYKAPYKATACLIAAAPDLLEAAQDALDALTNEDLDPQDAIDALEQAIAKATGGEA